MFGYLTRGADQPCPYCHSKNVRLATAAERPFGPFVPLTAFRKCELCGGVFEPPASMRLAVEVVLFGAAMIVATTVGLLMGDGLFSGVLWGAARYIVSAMALLGGVTIFWAGIRGVRANRNADHEEDDTRSI